MPDNAIILSVKNISRKYAIQTNDAASGGSFFALNNISFDLERGKILGIIGGNGAGKSTLLKILSEVIPPTSGTIEYEGTILSILEIGTGFHQDLSGYENIFLNASLLGRKKQQTEEVLDEIIDFSGIRPFIHESVKSYSSGMYLRLALSIALFTDYDIILLDEVISVGDAEFRLKAIKKLKEKIALGKTCIIISHDLHSVINICDECIILENGTIRYRGEAKAAVEDYMNSVDEKVHSKDTGLIEHEKCRYISCRLDKESYFLNEDIRVEVRFEKFVEEDIDIVLKVRAYDTLILSDCEIYRPGYKQKELSAGLYETVCVIPGNLFNAGNYKIDLLFGDKESALFTVQAAEKFKMQLPAWEAGKKWNEKDEGIPFRPVCSWKTKKLN